jgi:RNA polymerase sigma-70 factor (ECF subfamily)
LLADRRRRSRQLLSTVSEQSLAVADAQPLDGPLVLDARLAAALQTLSDADREALLLIAWEDLTPALAAASLGISQTAFRVRLYRARRRCHRALALSAEHPIEPIPTAPRLEQP